ncbi:MAG: tRNA (adenosine(37)-N6)-threonylcarbamoyltransferase complex dimerization subunit type 1 TsaB [Candidatus Omnitrophota bacterium]
MKILAVDTTTKFLTIGVYSDGRVGEYNLEIGRQLSNLITLTIKRVLDASGLDIKDIDYFACGLGPGSFTGIRTGISTIKGLAWATNKPVIGVSTLDILAKNVKCTEKQIVPVIDAKRDLVYSCIYKNKSGILKRSGAYMLVGIEGLLKKVKTGSIILGDAAGLYKDTILKNLKGAEILDKDYWYPKAHNLIELALEKIKANKLNDAFNITPLYLYPKECQIKK